jgi:hypothetical protein
VPDNLKGTATPVFFPGREWEFRAASVRMHYRTGHFMTVNEKGGKR